MDSLLQASSGSEVTISGGSFDTLSASAGSQVNFIGREFFINDQEFIVSEQAVTITNRGVTLSGLLADGQPFSFPLNTTFSRDGFFSSNATLTLTFGTTVILGDVNRDGEVDFLDIGPFIGVLSVGGTQAEADIDQSGVVDFLDIGPFIEILSLN